ISFPAPAWKPDGFPHGDRKDVFLRPDRKNGFPRVGWKNVFLRPGRPDRKDGFLLVELVFPHLGWGPADSLPPVPLREGGRTGAPPAPPDAKRSEEHTSEIQSREKLVCRLLLGK